MEEKKLTEEQRDRAVELVTDSVIKGERLMEVAIAITQDKLPHMDECACKFKEVETAVYTAMTEGIEKGIKRALDKVEGTDDHEDLVERLVEIRSDVTTNVYFRAFDKVIEYFEKVL